MVEAAILCFHSRPSAHDQNVPQAFRSGLRAGSVVALLSRFFRLDSSQDLKMQCWIRLWIFCKARWRRGTLSLGLQGYLSVIR
jgi:hypothetical protein